MKHFFVFAIVLVAGCTPDDQASEQPVETQRSQPTTALETDSKTATATGQIPEVSDETKASNDSSAAEQAIALLNRGEIEPAELLLRNHLQANAADLDARILLGQVLDFDGRPDDAAQVWKEGI